MYGTLLAYLFSRALPIFEPLVRLVEATCVLFFISMKDLYK